jgi:hypothetical protein
MPELIYRDYEFGYRSPATKSQSPLLTVTNDAIISSLFSAKVDHSCRPPAGKEKENFKHCSFK